MSIFWFNGDYFHTGDTIAISPLAPGLTLGSGIFETIKGIDGRPLALRRHLDRMAIGAEKFGLEIDSIANQSGQVLKELMIRNQLPNAKLRITAWQADHNQTDIAMTIQPLPETAQTLRVISVPNIRNPYSPTVGIKTTSYAENSLALKWARQRGGDEALLGNTQGNLSEGSYTNVFLKIDGQWITPPLSAGPLPGITRELVLQLAEETGIQIQEADIPIDQLPLAEELFATSSLRDIVPISKIDDRNLKLGRETQTLQDAFGRYIEKAGK